MCTLRTVPWGTEVVGQIQSRIRAESESDSDSEPSCSLSRVSLFRIGAVVNQKVKFQLSKLRNLSARNWDKKRMWHEARECDQVNNLQCTVYSSHIAHTPRVPPFKREQENFKRRQVTSAKHANVERQSAEECSQQQTYKKENSLLQNCDI